MPEDVEFPDEWADWIHEIQEGGTLPHEGVQFIEDNFPDWADAGNFPGTSPDTAALGIDFGYDSPEDIGSVTIHADGGDWWIEIDGVEYDLSDDNFASIWDWYDLADYYGFDFEKDIDTG